MLKKGKHQRQINGICAYLGTDNPGKRGPKPYFAGSRQNLLEDNLDEYVLLKFQNRNQFWFKFFATWWERYLWKLGNKDEPPLDDPVKMAELVAVGTEERERKSEVESMLVSVGVVKNEE